MQSSEKISLDTRTFPEIFQSLEPYWRNELRIKMTLRMRISEVTFYNWAKGAARPQSYSSQKEASAIIKSVLKLNVHPAYLFSKGETTNTTIQ